MASATFWGVGRGPGYFKAGVSQAPSTPKSAVGGKVVLEMGGGGIKRRGAGERVEFRHLVGERTWGSLLRGEMPGVGMGTTNPQN